jgi:hypothetical protein
MSDRDAGVGRDANATGDAWDHLEGDAGFRECGGLFAPTAKQERIAAFEAQHATVRSRQLDEQAIDLILRGRRTTTTFADKVSFDMRRNAGQDGGVDQVVVDHAVAIAEQISHPQRQQSRVSGTSTSEKDGSWGVGHRGAKLTRC